MKRWFFDRIDLVIGHTPHEFEMPHHTCILRQFTDSVAPTFGRNTSFTLYVRRNKSTSTIAQLSFRRIRQQKRGIRICSIIAWRFLIFIFAFDTRCYNTFPLFTGSSQIAQLPRLMVLFTFVLYGPWGETPDKRLWIGLSRLCPLLSEQ